MPTKQLAWYQKVLALIIACGALYLLGTMTQRESIIEQLQNATGDHLGVVLLVKSKTERDRPFVKALREVRSQLGGKAITLTTTGPEMPGITAETKLPLIRVIDSHGGTLDEIDEAGELVRLPELARELAEHHH